MWSVLGPYVNSTKTCSVISYSVVNSLKWLLQLKSEPVDNVLGIDLFLLA